MGRIFLTRHGQPDWGGEPRYTGTTDTPLSDLGRRQAARLAERLAGQRIDAVYSTGLRRTDDTAAAIARESLRDPVGRPDGTPEGRGLRAATVVELREINFGEWEGLTRGEIEARWPEVFAARGRDPAGVRCPGGENYHDLAARVLPAFHRLAQEHAEDVIAVVAHQATNRTILADILGLPLERVRTMAQFPAALNVIDNGEDGLVAVSINDTCHLDGLES